eukprot:CAMPEP_0182454510 /NCGR_PEP_ID=MMETSP1319-20130603/1114_1 /TAXON_ID=172717 /ORGANISM="Bolidomonas pacifica, Strain RCC208" /LENGTH=90 /DNA_ID=CAMNT_0024652527 /DNA_START=23 /DNA_END=295 /DNA_ORIENTATION=-
MAKKAAPKSPTKKAAKAKTVPGAKRAPRAMSSYMFWMTTEGRAASKKKLGANATIGEIGKEAGKMWAQKSDKEKEDWKQKALKAFAAKNK